VPTFFGPCGVLIEKLVGPTTRSSCSAERGLDFTQQQLNTSITIASVFAVTKDQYHQQVTVWFDGKSTSRLSSGDYSSLSALTCFIGPYFGVITLLVYTAIGFVAAARSISFPFIIDKLCVPLRFCSL
jgi:hypothetical protein